MSGISVSLADTFPLLRSYPGWIAWLRTFAFICVAGLLLCLPLAHAEAKATGLRADFEEVKAEAASVLGSPLGEHDYKKANELEDLRKRLARVRDRAQAIADEGTLESRQAQARLDALGPAPGDGESEAAFIASRRETLNDELARLFAPVLRAKEIQYQAASLVKDIDLRIHRLNNRHLYSRALSPLEPRLWSNVVAEFGGKVSGARTAGQNASVKSTGWLGWTLRIAGALAMLGGGIALHNLIWRKISRRVEQSIESRQSVLGKLALILIEDAGSAVLFGILLVLAASFSVLLFAGVASQGFILSAGLIIVIGGVLVALGNWLARSVLLSPVKELRLISLPESVAKQAYAVVTGIGIVLAFEMSFEMLEETGFVPNALVNLLSTLIIVVGSVLIWRLANLINTTKKPPAQESLETSDLPDKPHIDFSGTLGRIMKALALVAIATALTGYMVLAREVFSGVLLSLAVIAISVYAHRTVKLIVGALIEGPLGPYRSIVRFVPLIAGFALLVFALFVIALVWGYRLQEISDALILMRTGIEFGDVRLSAGDVFTFLLVFLVGFIVTRWVQRFLRLSLLPEFAIDRGAQAAIVTGIGYFGVMLAAVIAIAATGLDLTSLAFVFGALSVGIGFGLQSVVENFTSGILLLIERPIRVGDWIEVGEHSGIVQKIAVRSTQIETWDRHQIIIPNSQLISGSVKNLSFTGGPARVSVIAGVAYDSDVDAVRTLLLDIAKGHDKVLDQPEPFVTLDQFADNSINLKLFAYVADVTTGGGVRSDLNFAIAKQFAEQGIEIPFPQRDLHLRNGLDALAPGGG